jgi:ectoine hydroxylase-related dioxygenase (phytanoyl-CoA dioxygenase family)
MVSPLRLDSTERDRLANQGFAIRRGVFSAAELAAIAADCEALVARLLEERRRTRLEAGSYRFEIQGRLRTTIKWEADHPEVVQGVEPFAHLSPALEQWGLDSRLVDPCKDVVGADEVALFTEKLNLKRARGGGPIVLHQDFPYWSELSPVAGQVATAIIFLDDATRENGCLEVAPGSHRGGLRARRSVEGFGNLEMDPARYDLTQLVAVEVPAGSVVFFGAFLVHRSMPNRSGADRRALLYSYQPAGHPHLRDLIRFAPVAAR